MKSICVVMASAAAAHISLIARGGLGCLLIIGLPAQGSESVAWLIDESDFAHYYQSETQISIGLDTTNLVLNRLDEFSLTFTPAPVARINQELRAGQDVCSGNRLKNRERAQQGIFSLPMALHPSPRLYYREDQIQIPARLRSDDGRLTSLQDLLDANPDMTLGLARGLSYGSTLDAAIADLDAPISLYKSEKRYQGGPKLLAQGLIDMSLLYSSQFEELSEKIPESTPNIASIGLQQTPRFLRTFITCSRSKLGHRVIRRVNTILRELYSTPEFIRAHTRYLPASEHAALEDSVAELRQLSDAQSISLQ